MGIHLRDDIDEGVDHLGGFEINVEFGPRKSLECLHQCGKTLAEAHINPC